MPKDKRRSSPPMVGVRIPADAHRKAKVYAAEKDLDLWQVLEEAVNEYLSNKKKRNG